MYFLGFAGVGEQKVFAEEIALAARRVHERYDTHWRRVTLVNDRRDYDTHPLASPAALQRALHGTAQRMDRERDVLFLALSSHGKRDAKLVVTNGALPLNWLTGKDLARMLRESGIRWKVVVISACYAGAFIEHLRDDHTIVITASSPDRTSFGCNDRRDSPTSARPSIAMRCPRRRTCRRHLPTPWRRSRSRERSEGLAPSQPRAHFGAAMVARLSELEALRWSQGTPALGSARRGRLAAARCRRDTASHARSGYFFRSPCCSQGQHARQVTRQPPSATSSTRRLRSFLRQTGSEAHVYFLGFAGYGEERVFAEEIKLAARNVGENYGSASRSVLLLNDRRDLPTYPLASEPH